MRPRKTLTSMGLAGLIAATTLALGGTATAADDHAPLIKAKGDAVAGEYVVKTRTAKAAKAVAERAGVRPSQVYRHVLTGFAARMDKEQLNDVRQDARVERVSENFTVAVPPPKKPKKSKKPALVESWGLDRIDQEDLPLDDTYDVEATGEGVTAYIIDTGIDPGHSDFEGRAEIGHDSIGGDGMDCNGHGTHVAGTVGSATYGVAKQAKLVGVRVLNCSGSGTSAGVIGGMDWVAENAEKPAVANMSLGGPGSDLNEAADNLTAAGVFLAVAAGNDSGNACNTTPAGAETVFTTAASDDGDNPANFSAHGQCVEAYAPGVGITSTWLNGGTNTISGTSMASPHAAGVGALYKQAKGDDDQQTINDWIVENASSDKISNPPSGTPNKLLFTADL